jgi:hypothetical protein
VSASLAKVSWASKQVKHNNNRGQNKLATNLLLLSHGPLLFLKMTMTQNSRDGQAGTIFFGSAGHSSHSVTGGFGFLHGFRACQRFCLE